MKYAVLLLVILCSCSATKNTSADNTTSITATDRIAFVTFKITKGDSLHPSSLALVKTNITAGTFKQRHNEEDQFLNRLKIEVYEQGELRSTTVIEHPLYKDIEFTDSSNVLSMKHIELPEANFFVRLQLTGPSSRIKIIESLEHHLSTELTVIDL